MKWKKTGEDDRTIGWRKVFARHYELPNGKEKTCDITDHHDSACVLAITPQEEVVLVEQFRPGPERIITELPGGLVDPGESPQTTAARELLEETGYKGFLEFAGCFWLDAYSVGKKYCFLAKWCDKVAEQRLDDGEFIRVKLMPLDIFRIRLDHSEMMDAASAYRALRKYDRKMER